MLISQIGSSSLAPSPHDDKMKQLNVGRLLEERLTVCTNVFKSSTRKKQETGEKSKVASMIKAAEGTVAKIGQLADNAIAAIGKARSDLVIRTSIPQEPVANKMVRLLC
jgi:hypothetical protein